MNSNTMGTLPHLLKRLWHHLSRRRHYQFLLLMILTFVSALAEVVSLGAIIPFLSILTTPEVLYDHPLVNEIVTPWGITAADQLVLPITVFFIVAALAAGGIRMLLLWVGTRLAFASGADFSIEAYRRTLYQPYQEHVRRNSSEVINGVTNKVNRVVFEVILPFMTLITSIVLLITIMVTLIYVNPLMALAAGGGFGIFYGLITLASRKQLARNSRCIAHEQTQVIKALQEGLGGIRDVLLDGTQSVYCDIYRQADLPLRKAQGINVFIAGGPRFAMEAIGIVVIAIIAYGFNQSEGGIVAALPMLGALALGAQRMLPALQQSFAAWASIKGCQASLADTIEFLDQEFSAEEYNARLEPSSFAENVQFMDVGFRYGPDSPWVIKGLNLTIKKGTRVGLVGSTGGGKSTTLDLLMGLLLPVEGDILVDGEKYSGDRLKSFQKTIAHVPQSIYLADATIAENIAFGVPVDAINMERVRQVAHQAQIADFIESRPEGYDLYVGERGIRLSGGQRQRIGIARALYKQADVLVFDEATSALDTTTEQAVMDAIEALHADFTILIIAHRLTTVKRCDSIIELRHGQVVAEGTYEQLLGSSASFRSLAMDEHRGGDAQC